MSRLEKFGRSKQAGQSLKAKAAQASGAGKDKEPKLPPRRKKYPSSAQTVTKWFYNLLIVIFLGLVVFLFWYGIKFS